MTDRLIDTSVLIDVLRGHRPAVDRLVVGRRAGVLHTSVVVQAEVLAGMRPAEEPATRALLDSMEVHPVSAEVADAAGALGRRWLPSHGGIDTADLLIAATADLLGISLWTTNVRHFPMFPGLAVPYSPVT